MPILEILKAAILILELQLSKDEQAKANIGIALINIIKNAKQEYEAQIGKPIDSSLINFESPIE